LRGTCWEKEGVAHAIKSKKETDLGQKRRESRETKKREGSCWGRHHRVKTSRREQKHPHGAKTDTRGGKSKKGGEVQVLPNRNRDIEEKETPEGERHRTIGTPKKRKGNKGKGES